MKNYVEPVRPWSHGTASMRGTGTTKPMWIGKWWKPWTWFGKAYHVKVMTDFRLFSVDISPTHS